MTTDRFDKRIPTFIQFTDEDYPSRRSSKRRSGRVQQGTQQGNKKRKKSTSATPKQISLEKKDDTNLHQQQQQQPISNQDSVTVKNACNTTLDKTSPISNDKTSPQVSTSVAHSPEYISTLPFNNNDGGGGGDTLTEQNTDSSDGMPIHHEQISPLSHRDNNRHQLVSSSPDQKYIPLTSLSIPDKTTTTTTPFSVYTQHLEFDTITLSPDHDRKKMIPPPPSTPPPPPTAVVLLDSPQKLIDSTTCSTPQTDISSTSSSPVTNTKTSPSPPSSPTLGRRKLVFTPSPALPPLPQSKGPSTASDEFYSPKMDFEQQTNDDDDDDDDDDKTTTTQDNGYSWPVTMRIRNFFDRLKMVLQ